ncbi:uncharacterized protein LOC130668147 [Microplitis mediator]|uniref:uncharacterized protein LOC130668147 n=1 Tax=Microplitis mediator TaxID=375433 RepID=UPI0025549A18|nr:uncharacterized protein LOC130668147 [Microplitis mediator]
MNNNRQSPIDNSYEYLAVPGTSKQQPENKVYVSGNNYVEDKNNTFKAPVVKSTWKSTSGESQKIIMNNNRQSPIDNSYEYLAVPGTSKQQPENKVYVSGNNYVEGENNTLKAPLVKEQQPLQQQQGQYEYKEIQEYTEQLLKLKQELNNEITKNPILWCNVGSYYSIHCQKILITVSSELEYLATIQSNNLKSIKLICYNTHS